MKGRQNSAGGWKWRYAEGEKKEEGIDKSKWIGRRFTLKGSTPLEVVDVKEGETPIIVMEDRSTGKVVNYTPQTFATALQEGILVEESQKLSWQFLKDQYPLAFEFLEDYFKAHPYSNVSKDDMVYELTTHFELDLEEAEEIYTQFITDYWSKKYKTKLSWQDLTSPEKIKLKDLPGWMVKIKNRRGIYYGVVQQMGGYRCRNWMWAIWKPTEKEALEAYKENPEEPIMDEGKLYFEEYSPERSTVLYRVALNVWSNQKLSWKELSYTGRVLEWLDKQSAKSLPDSTIKQILYGAGFRGDNIDYLLEEWKKYKRSRYSNQDFNSYKDQNVSLYRKRLNYYNENEGANIFWSSKDAQEKRFKALTDIGDLEDTEILDVGCGYCDLLTYLEKNDINPKNYVGIDIVPEIVEKAKELHPDINIQVRDIQEELLEENSFDWVFGSGIFALQDQNWQQYVVNMLKEMLKIARKGVAVNFLKQQNTNRLSWQEPPQNLIGWLVKLKRKGLDNRISYGVVYSMFDYFTNDKKTFVYSAWLGSSE